MGLAMDIIDTIDMMDSTWSRPVGHERAGS
jgi:hypothetical protein